MKLVKLFSLIFFGLYLSSCSEEEFAAVTQDEESTVDEIREYSEKSCSNYTLIKPKVDFLFIWDNSSSKTFISDETSQALSESITLISDRFDYHILIAPLLGDDNSNYLIAENPEELEAEALSILVEQSSAASLLQSFEISGETEAGLDRTVNLLESNIENGIFREDAYTIIVIMSNGDDLKKTPSGFTDGLATSTYIEEKFDEMKSIKSTLSSEQMRFISLVPHSTCESGYISNSSYVSMSSKIHTLNSELIMNSTTPDSYDICGKNFENLFDEVNSTIYSAIESHVYRYWPVTKDTNARINPDKITVTKSNGDKIARKSESSSNGFELLSGIQTKDTRELPTVGEPVTGILIELFGDSKVKYPDCLIVETEDAVDYYGYIHLQTKPFEASIKVTINGKEIKESSSNGWKYIGYQQSLNMMIDSDIELNTSSGFYTEPETELNKTGYFLQLYGDAIYNNGASINVVYDPAAVK